MLRPCLRANFPDGLRAVPAIDGNRFPRRTIHSIKSGAGRSGVAVAGPRNPVQAIVRSDAGCARPQDVLDVAQAESFHHVGRLASITGHRSPVNVRA
jgi:hypothetical protein